MSQPLSETIGKIQRLAKQRGWTTVHLAKMSGVSQRTAYNVLRGVTDTTTARAEAMLRALESPAEPPEKSSKKMPSRH